MVRQLFPILVAALALFAIMAPISDVSNGSYVEDSFSLTLTDKDGNDLKDPIFGDVTIFFDTYNAPNGTIYKLKAMLSIRTIPTNLVINASGGLFKLAVSAQGMDSFLTDTGMRITITNDDKTYNADLRSSNNYSDEFRHDSNVAALDPNVIYSVSVSLIDGYESPVSPESVSNIKITFQAIASDGFHQVMFISQDETVESYMAFDNYVIEKVPEVSRSGYSFQGWFTPDGRQITDGYVISPNEGDIIAYAEWEKDESNNTLLYVGIGGGSALLAGALLLLLLKKKRDSEPQ